MSEIDDQHRRSVLSLMGAAAAAAMLKAAGAAGAAASAEQTAGKLFDCHVHAIINDPQHYPLSDEFKNLSKDIFDISPTVERLVTMMDTAGVSQAVLVQHDPVFGDDNSYIADAARKYPDRMVAVGRLNAGLPDVVKVMTHWVRDRGLAGFRVNGPGGMGPGGMVGGPGWIDGAEGMRVWQTGAELNAPLLILISENNRTEALAAVGRALTCVPKVRLVLDHLADYKGNGEAVPETVPAELLDAARWPNLYVKVSTHNLKRLALAGGSPRAAMKKLVAAFGAGRLIWGSDVGNTRTPYADMIGMARDAMADLSPKDQELVLNGTAMKLYRGAA